MRQVCRQPFNVRRPAGPLLGGAALALGLAGSPLLAVTAAAQAAPAAASCSDLLLPPRDARGHKVGPS